MYCTTCGNEVNNASFCPVCGTAIKNSALVNTDGKAKKPVNNIQNKKKKTNKTRKLLVATIAIILVIAIVVASVWFIIPLIKGKNTEATAETVAKEEKEVFSIESIIASERDIQTYDTVSTLIEVKLSADEDCSELDIVTDKGKSIGTVNDNGENGDRQSNDGVYAGMVSFYSENAVEMNIYASYEEKISDKYETIYFYPEYKDEFYYEYKNLDETINDIYFQYSDIEEAHNAIIENLTEKKEAGEIDDFEFESGSIIVKLASGSTYVYSYNPGGEFKAPGLDSTDSNSQEVDLYTISPNVNSAVSLQPYRYELGAGGVDEAAETVADSDYNYIFNANFDNSDVDLELMKELNRYNIILLDGHGGHSSDNHSFFGVGTEITPENEERYWPDIHNNRVIHLSGGQYGVTPAFFEHHYEYNDFGDTIVYLGCCHGADDSVLADTFISKGVDAVFAYKNSVSVSYDTQMVTTIFEELSREEDQPVTVKTALENAQAQNGKTDNSQAHWYNWIFGNYQNEANRAQLYLFGNPNFTLSMEKGSLRGKVADCLTDEPIYNAYITATPVGETVSADYMKTDESGNFNLPLEENTYNITVQASGYMNCIINNVKIENNSTTYLQNTILLEQKDDNSITAVGGKITNAVTGEVVEGATIVFRSNYNQLRGDYVKDNNGNTIQLTSDAYGLYYTNELAYGYYTAEISKQGYVTQYVNVIASEDEQISGNQNILITPEASGTDFRITLEWEENPRDEDAHIVGDLPGGFHVYYMNKSAYYDGECIANLDHDDTQGNGFETVTLKADPSGVYKYYVYHYAGSGSLSTSNAIVKVYQGGVMIKQYNVPVDQGTGRYWNVFNIVDGKVVTINRISDSESQ